LAETKGLTFSFHIGDVQNITADRDLIFQAVANLTDNAIKYTPAGGSVTLHAAGNTVTVSDSGPGVPEDAREDVFRRFHRLEESRNAPGSGLGLSLVRAVAQLHDGDVRLEENRPGLKVVLTVG
jgi:signal transduction histidine kinase